MNHLKSRLTILAAGIAALAWSPALASPAPGGAKSVVLKTDDAMRYIQALAASFGSSYGLTYVDKLTVKSYASGGAPAATLNIKGQLGRPNKYRLDLGSNGTLISDGVHNIALDPSNLHYSRYAAPGDLTLGAHWTFISSNVLTGASALDQSLVPYLYAHINDFDFLHPTRMAVTGAKVTIGDSTYVDVDYRGEGDDIHLKFDPATMALIGADATYTDSQGRTTEAIEQFTALTPLPTAPPARTFSTTPPAGAVEIAIPRDTPIAPKPRAPQKQSRPRRNPGYFYFY